MKALRAFFYLFLLANLILAFAGLGGFFHAPGGEPERLSSQFHPEKIRVLPQEPESELAKEEPAAVEEAEASAPASSESSAPETASQAKPAPVSEEPAPLACVSWSGLSRSQAGEISLRARNAGFKTREQSVSSPSAWWVHLPAQSDRATAERKAAELRSLGVTDFFIISDPGPTQNAISLGLYKNEDLAKRMLDQLKTTGVQSARISVRETVSVKLEVSGAARLLSGFSSEANSRAPAASRASCTRR